jgi:hypothetical protein
VYAKEALAIALYVSYSVHVRACKPLFEAPELLRGGEHNNHHTYMGIASEPGRKAMARCSNQYILHCHVYSSELNMEMWIKCGLGMGNSQQP